MTFTLPKLPYAKDALAPHISAETIDYHYGKHHQAYVDNLNKLIMGTEFESKTLPEIIKAAKGGIFNNAAQVWNHSFYWQCLKPSATNADPSLNAFPEKIATAITNSFGSMESFKEKFMQTAVAHFGSGWVWLVKKAAAAQGGELEIIATSNADNPMLNDKIALLVCDVWEHAYYIDYRNARAKYLEGFWKLINWEFVESNLRKSQN